MRIIIIAGLTLATLTACGGGDSAGSSPEETFEKVRQAMLNKDWATVWEYMPPAEREKMEKDLPTGASSAREHFFKKMDAVFKMNPDAMELARTAKLVDAKIDGDRCTITVKTKKGEQKSDMIRVDGRWYISVLQTHKESVVAVPHESPEINEQDARRMLKSIATAQAEFSSNDRDGDGKRNFWVKDIAGLAGLENPKGSTIRLIDLNIARADATTNRGSYASVKGVNPISGYYFETIERFETGDDKALKYDADGNGRNNVRFAFAAFPSKYPRYGRMTYVITEGSKLWAKDRNGTPPPQVWPKDPTSEGWKAID